MRSKLTVTCFIVGVLLTACSTDSKTSPSDSPSSNVVTSGSQSSSKPYGTATPTPLKSPTPYASPANNSASEDSKEGFRQSLLAASRSTITYEQLTKNADRYRGELWAFRGSIIQIQESGRRTSALVALDVFHDKIMKVTANFTTEFVDKDEVYVAGHLNGYYSYKSEAGWDITVPLIDARVILKPSEAARIMAGNLPSKK